MSATASISPPPAAYPPFAPIWAEVFGEDDFGIFAEFSLRDVRFVWRWIPPGRFLMGSPADEPGRYDEEGAQREVTLTRGYWLGEAPVTQAQWMAITGGSPSHFQGPSELPVEQVSWLEARSFAATLNELVPGLAAALPTEAQWEHACRAGTTTALPTGGITLRGENDAPELDAIAWYGGNSGNDLEVSNGHDSRKWPQKQYPHREAGAHRVKLKQPNPWGIYDMLGNVWEWCADAWSVVDSSEAQRDPLVKGDDEAGRVVRGGSWSNHARGCRSACRSGDHPGNRRLGLGLRLAAGQELQAAEPQARSAPEGPDRR